MRRAQLQAIIAGSAALAFAVACQPETSQGDTETELREAGDALEREAREAGDEIEQGAREAGEEIEQGARELGDEAEDAADDATRPPPR